MSGPTREVTWYFNIVVTWQIRNVTSLILQFLQPPNLAAWWLKMRRPYLQNHVTSIMWSRDKPKTLYIHVLNPTALNPWQRTDSKWGAHPKSHMTFQFCSHVAIWKLYISSAIRPMAPKRSRVVTRKAKWHFYFVFMLQRPMADGPWHWLRISEHH